MKSLAKLTSIAAVATAVMSFNPAYGLTEGPVDCTTNEGCPATAKLEFVTEAPDLIDNSKAQELILVAGGFKCTVEVVVSCGGKKKKRT